MTTRTIITIITSVLLASCHKYLDVKPKGSLIPVTVSDFDHLLDNSYSMEYNFLDNNRGSVLSYLTDNLQISEGQAKVGFILNSHPNIDRYYGYVYRQPYRNPNTIDYFWGAGLQGVYSNASYFNNTIEGIKGIANKSAADEALGRQSIAQALVGRAWAYWNMNMIYGPVYKPNGNNTTKTIPFVTSPDINSPIPQLSTSQEIVTKVMNDLYAALPDLPATASWPSRANKATGQAMLAYCHLFTQKYDSVLYYANAAWTSSGANPAKLFYDYNTFSFSTPSNLVNSLISTTQDAYINAVNSRENLFYRGTDATAGIGTALSYPSDELIGLYDQANDLRFKFYYISTQGYKTTLGGGYDDGIRISNYRWNKVKVTDGFSFPEVLLMRAEAYARTNQLNAAIADLNTLRQYRFKPGTPQLTVGSQDDVINQVLQERRRELPIGGIKRLLDLKRFTLDAGKPWAKTQITHTVGTASYTGTVDSPDCILTISNTVLQYHPQWGIQLDNRPW